MRSLRALLMRMRNLVGQGRTDLDLTDELQAHLDLHIEDNLRAGMSFEDARRDALAKIGGISLVTEQYRDRNGVPAIENIVRDFRQAVRQLVKNPAFSITAGLTLVLCIGANTALFTVVYTVLFRPLLIPESDRIVLMSNQYPGANGTMSIYSGVPDYYDRLRDTSVFEEQALFQPGNVSLDQNGTPTRVPVMNVTPSLFRLLRVPPQLGRTFVEQEGELGNETRVVLSDGLWHSLFGGQLDVVGQDVRLDGRPYTIVGVMPPTFTFIDHDVRLWRPLALTAEQKSDQARHANSWWNIGRLKPGATLALAQRQIDALNAANLDRFPQWKAILLNAKFYTLVERLQDRLVREVKPTLYLLWGGALFVLLIGGLNTANLVLVRSWARLRELATRLALGAGWWRIARQLVLETLVLAIVSAVLGLVLAYGGVRALAALDLQSLPRRAEIELTSAAVLYACSGAAIIGLLLGLLPAVVILPADLNTALRGRDSSRADAQSFRRALAVAQVAFAFVLLIGAGLLLTSFRRVLAVDPGFAPDRALTASVSLPISRYPNDAARRGFMDGMLDAIRALPGVSAAGATDTIPLGGFHRDNVILAEGHQMQPGESLLSPSTVVTTPGYFNAIGARLKGGRWFDERDSPDAPRVVVIDETLAHRFWPGENAVGRRLYRPVDINHLQVTDKTVFLNVVGVVADLKLDELAMRRESMGATYVPYAQQSLPGPMTFAVQTAGDPTALAGSVRQAINARDRELPVFNVQTLRDGVNRSLINRRAAMLLAVSFSVLALLLTAIGIYGVLAYLVTRRTNEIGIRVALGSTARAIMTLILREGFVLVGIGLLLGAVGAMALRRSLDSQLFGVRATDPMVLGTVVLVLGLVAVTACVVPARRAVRIEPMTALRAE